MAQAVEAARAAALARGTSPERPKGARGPVPAPPQAPTPAVDVDIAQQQAWRDRNGRGGR